MHVKSIYKRLCGEKGPIDRLFMTRMQYYTDDSLSVYTHKQYTVDEKINRALATDGSAGQFAKQSNYEEMWKNKSSSEAMEIWRKLTSQIIEQAYVLNDVPEEIVAYMLYRKREAINSKDDGSPKETRVMNAPNLVARVTDSVVMTEFNEAVINSRVVDTSSLGINVFVEMKQVIFFNKLIKSLVADFADYDGSQHPAQGFMICKMRMKYMLLTGAPVEHVAYMLPRYKKHMVRTVKSTWGIEYDVVGQQASGDLTTSDDNTVKTKAVVVSVLQRFHKLGMIKMIKKVPTIRDFVVGDKSTCNVTADDVFITFEPTDKWDDEKAERIYKEESARMGWNVKEGSFAITPMLQDGTNEYLSHTVKRRKFYSQYKDSEIEFAALSRPQERSHAKWCIAAELGANPNRQEKAKLVSKYLTLTMVSIGNPEVIASSLHMLYKLKASCGKFTSPYNWSGISATTIKNLDLNCMLELQLNVMFAKRYDYIEISQEEAVMIKSIIDELKCDMYTDISNGTLPSFELSRFEGILTDALFNYRQLKDIVQSAYGALSLASRIVTPPEAYAWWTDYQLPHLETGRVRPAKRITSCVHTIMIPEMVTCKPGCKIKFKCEECFKNDNEKQYEGINIKIIQTSGYKKEVRRDEKAHAAVGDDTSINTVNTTLLDIDD
jgi:hypothetical protein